MQGGATDSPGAQPGQYLLGHEGAALGERHRPWNRARGVREASADGDCLFIVRQVTCEDEKIRCQTMVTPTGQVWLHQRWEARQLIIARNAARDAERARDEQIARGLFD